MSQTVAEIDQEISYIKRILASKKSVDDLLTYTKYTMPAPEDPDNTDLSLFEEGAHHQIVCDALQKLEEGKEYRRLIVVLPPRHTKSELCTRRFPAWCQGRHPRWEQIVAGYSEKFGQQEFGKPIKNILLSKAHIDVFPKCQLSPDSKSSGFLETSRGGKITTTGIDGSITGKGAHLFVIDDPYKNNKAADSQTVRDTVWDWFFSTVRTRLMPGGRILIVMTRWHEDDIVGRIQNPDYYDVEEAAKWHIVHMPALADENGEPDDVNGKALWPEWYDEDELYSIKAEMSSGQTLRWWNSLYQGCPTTPEGEYFTNKMIQTYNSPDKRPLHLNHYMGMDLAVSEEKRYDASVALTAGMDKDGNLWIMDALWERKKADELVDALVAEMKRFKPQVAWGEKGQISKSIGPFLYRKMKEEGFYTYIEEENPVGDKATRARSIRGMMAAGKVFFPSYAPWYKDALAEMLKFPNGKNDDFIDALALLGLGLERQSGNSGPKKPKKKSFKSGTMGWMKAQSKYEERRKLESEENTDGW